jgi:hypothetical protein
MQESRCPLWKARILQAEKSGEFTREDKVLANFWNHCLVGEYLGRFDGFELHEHDGINFFKAVAHDDVESAKKIFRKVTREEI